MGREFWGGNRHDREGFEQRAVENQITGAATRIWARKRLKQNDFLGKAFLLLYTKHNKLTMSDSLSPRNLEWKINKIY